MKYWSFIVLLGNVWFPFIYRMINEGCRNWKVHFSSAPAGGGRWQRRQRGTVGGRWSARPYCQCLLLFLFWLSYQFSARRIRGVVRVGVVSLMSATTDAGWRTCVRYCLPESHRMALLKTWSFTNWRDCDVCSLFYTYVRSSDSQSSAEKAIRDNICLFNYQYFGFILTVAFSLYL